MKHLIYLSILILTIIVTSCAQNDKARVMEHVGQWFGRHLHLPTHIIDALTGDTISMSDSEFTILTYIDSLGCTRCKMKLHRWNEFLGSLDSITESDVVALMVIHTSDSRGIRYQLKIDGYEYPSYIDSTDIINKHNAFPSELMLQTFLLDSSHHVIAVGNPVYNNRIANLYRDIISGGKIVTQAGSIGIMVNVRSLDIGDIHLGETANHNFVLKNVSGDTVNIRKMISSCDCTVAEVENTLIVPGDSATIYVSFKEDSITGRFNRTVHVFYDQFTNPTKLEITGNVIK